MKTLRIKLHPLDLIPLGLIAAHSILLFVNRQYLPFSYDTPYHLLMGKMFSDFGGVVLWDYYEYAPVGRPHLYPPLLHILIWWTHALTGLDFVSVGRLIALVQYPASLLLSWLAIRLLFGPEVGAVYLGLLSADSWFWTWQLTVDPTALIMALYMPFLYFFTRKKVLPSTLLMTAFLYSHLGLPYVALLSMVVSTLLAYPIDRGYLGQSAKVATVSLLAFSPWALHVINNLEALQAVRPRVMVSFLGFLSLDIFYLVLIPVGIYVCLRKGAEGRILLGSFLGFTAILPTYGFRYFLHSPPVNAAVAALGFGLVVEKVKPRLGGRGALTLVAVFALTASVFAPSLAPRMGGGPAPIVREVTDMSEVIPERWQIYSVTNPYVQELARWIEENVPEGEILHVGWTAGRLHYPPLRQAH